MVHTHALAPDMIGQNTKPELSEDIPNRHRDVETEIHHRRQRAVCEASARPSPRDSENITLSVDVTEHKGTDSNSEDVVASSTHQDTSLSRQIMITQRISKEANTGNKPDLDMEPAAPQVSDS